MQDLKQRVEAILSELQYYEDNAKNHIFGGWMHDTIKLIKDLAAENQRLREALEFYADETKYVNGAPKVTITADYGEPVPGRLFSGIITVTNNDNGKTAKQALSGVTNE